MSEVYVVQIILLIIYDTYSIWGPLHRVVSACIVYRTGLEMKWSVAFNCAEQCSKSAHFGSPYVAQYPTA